MKAPTSNEVVTKKAPWPRRTQWTVGVLFLFLGAFLVWRTSIWGITRIQVALVHKAGYPVSLEELDRWYPVVPDSENDAVVYGKAFSLLRIDTKAEMLFESERTNSLAKSVTLSAERKGEIVALLAANAEALQLLERGAQYGRCRYPLNLKNGYDEPMSYLPGVKNGVQLLLLKAVLAAGEDKPAEAYQALLGALDLSRSLAGEPDCGSEHTRVIAVGRTLRVLELLLSRRIFTAAQLGALAGRMHPEEFPAALERALAGERCKGIDAFGRSAAEWFGPEIPAGASRRMAFQKVTGIWDWELSLYLSLMGKNVEAARWPFALRMAKAEELQERIATKHDSDPELFELVSCHSAATMLLPPISTSHLRSAETQAALMAAQIALAIECYRARNTGQLPAQLADLVSKELPFVPADPFDGKPFRYKRLNQGYVVYSVGADGKDDAGLKKDRSRFDAPYDVLFSVER